MHALPRRESALSRLPLSFRISFLWVSIERPQFVEYDEQNEVLLLQYNSVNQDELCPHLNVPNVLTCC